MKGRIYLLSFGLTILSAIDFINGDFFRDIYDAYKDKVYQMVYRVTSDRVTSGCVVQFHINGYHTAEVLDKALDNWINVKGLRPVTIGELMQLSGRDFPPLPDYD